MIDKGLLKLIGNAKGKLIWASVLMILGYFASMLFFVGIALTVYAYAGAHPELELSAILTLTISLLAAFGLNSLQGVVASDLGSQVRKTLRHQALAKTLRLKEKAFKIMPPSAISQLAMEGMESLDTYFSAFLPSFFYAMAVPVFMVIACVLCYAFILPQSPMLWVYALTMILLVPLMPMSIMAISKMAKRIFAKYWDKYLAMGAQFMDAVKGLEDLKNFNAATRKGEALDANAEAFRKATMKVLTMQLYSVAIMDTVTYGGAGAGIFIAVWYAVALNTLLGYVVALALVLSAVWFFLPLRTMGSMFHIAMNGVMAGKKLQALLNAKEPEWGQATPDSFDMALSGVSFVYSDAAHTQAVTDVSLRFPKTGLVAIVGKSGAGKSTLASILSGSERPTQGEVSIGSVPIQTVDRKWFYRHVGFLSANSHLFYGTLKDSFRFFSPKISDEGIRALLTEVKLDYLLDRPEGLSQAMAENAKNLSGGERQRLALALLLSSPREVLILDEATASVDVESEAILFSALKKLSQTSLVIVITHRLDEALAADWVGVMDQGKIVQTGSPKALSRAPGALSDLLSANADLLKGLD